MEVDDDNFDLVSEVKIETEMKSEPRIVQTIVDNKTFPEKYHEIYGAYKLKDYDKCLSYIDEVTEEHIEYQILKSACMIHSGKKVSDAHKILDDVLEKDPNNAYTLYAKGLAFYHEDKWEESIEYFEWALEFESDMQRAEVMREKAQERIDERDESAKTVTPMLTIKRSPPYSNHIVRRFGCEICNHFFGKKFNLDRHNRSIHKRDTPMNFPTTPKKQGASITIKSPVSTTPRFAVKCESMDESVSSTKSEPTRSRAPASKRGRVKCHTCKKMFKKSSIARHAIIHTGTKPHKCTECTMAFFQKSDLTRHYVSWKLNSGFGFGKFFENS